MIDGTLPWIFDYEAVIHEVCKKLELLPHPENLIKFSFKNESFKIEICFNSTTQL